MASDDDILKDAREAFQLASDAENENRNDAIDDLRFARLDEQWPDEIRRQREEEGRPVLTINRLRPVIRQVVNDARQNKPSIRVHPVDSGADPETANIINGLIRNIEYTSNADVAYDTAADCAVTMGFGYLRIGLDYAHDDSFDLDITINRVSNPLSVYGDPHSTAADSSDWMTAFVVESMRRSEFEARFKGASASDWDALAYGSLEAPWLEDDAVLVAEWFKREEVPATIYRVEDAEGGIHVFGEERMKNPDVQAGLAMGFLTVTGERQTITHKVKRHLLTGAEVLETEDWPGRYIPIIPVYGDEVNAEGKRYFRSLIRDAKDAQRMFNYWRTIGTEMVALAPKVPFIGPAGAFETDAAKWANANRISYPYIEYDVVPEAGGTPPQRQPLDTGGAAGALQEALNASDDIKAITGIYDASLGARSNETSGRAILARQREGDISTFHFLDNLTRAIRHTGRIIVDLIPHVYTNERIIRVLGEAGQSANVPLGRETQEIDPNTGQPVVDPQTGQPRMRVYDLTAGKYDVTVKAGPSFTTQREEAAAQMTEWVRAQPELGLIIGDLLAGAMDWPQSDEIAKRLKAEYERRTGGGKLPPEVQQAIEQGKQRIAELERENAEMKADRTVDATEAQIKAMEAQNKTRETDIKAYSAETGRMKVVTDAEAAAVAAARAEMERVNRPQPMPGAVQGY